ncbi:LPS translocon maturation chaperone LptM [Massilia yuzhufengensis]|uniref:LPS translocon maturation chaperone LptM n=1 Tax=Massilia yuzhufengensis TaxID=1164594 RepID=UPI000B188EB4|nr:lipoprotein [Massilia yuzhufengensis]
MKSSTALLSGAALAAAFAGCGQTGPLYMPNPPAKPAPAATAAANPQPAQPVSSNNASTPAPTK